MAGTGVQVPAAMEDIVLRLLKRDPAERFQTARELKAALESVAGGGAGAAPARARAQGKAGAPAAGAPGRGRMVAVAAGVAVLLGAGVFVAHPWGRTLEATDLGSLAGEGKVASARLAEGGIEGRLSRGPLPSVRFSVPLAQDGVAAAITTLRAAGVNVDTSLEVDRLITRAAGAQSLAHYYGYDGDDVRGYAERAAALDPESGEARSLLRKVAERMAWDADAALADGDPDRARDLAGQCLALVPDHARCLASRGGA
jgi:hypothetical protein